MDKNEYNLKLEEIHKLMKRKDYEGAVKIADTIDWKRIRNIRTLCMVSEIYEAVDRLEESKEILLRAYQSSQISRIILYRLTEVAIKRKEFDEAVEYYGEFVNAAPKDTTRYILKYKIYRGRGSSLEEQIQILEEYKDIEYTEHWSYELAKLYLEAGKTKKSIDACDDLILWFRQGEYVIKALELKKSVTDLTPMQQTIYNHRNDPAMKNPSMVEDQIPELEKVILEGMPASQEEAITDNIITETQRELAQAVSQHAAEPKEDTQHEAWDDTISIPDVESNMKKPVTGDAGASIFDVEDLQQELAKSMHDIVSVIAKKENDTEIIEPMNDNVFSLESNDAEEGRIGSDDEDDEEMEGQITIDDVLTSMAMGKKEESVQPADESNSDPYKTIDLSQAVEAAAGVSDMKPSIESSTRPSTKPEVKQEKIFEVKEQLKLTLDEQYIFSFFAAIQGMEEQIASALYDIKDKVKKDKTSRSGNIVITGSFGSGRTTLGIQFAKMFSKLKGESAARVARIDAKEFNKKDIPATVAKIAGGTLIIEEACDLEDEVVKIMSKAMEFKTDGLLVILEDESKRLKELFDRHSEFAEKFTSEIIVPVYTNDELVSFGKTYAYDEDYKIDDMATLELYNRIGEMQSPDHPVNIYDVKEIIDKAIKRSERIGFRKLGMILSKKRYDEDDRIILYEKDFK